MVQHATEANSLANASSSYLRSAMHQPIRWYEWSNEAFETAQRENKPMLLDIGAVWCHWCHVMDRESYDNPEIARIINDNFIAIKVDRDERPDVDSRYQTAVQAISGQGGWPLTAFLTPDGRPFFGGTYFPPDDHWGRPGFKRVLLAIAESFREKHGEVLESAESVMSAVSHETFQGRSADVNPKSIQRIIESALRQFDSHYGGFGSAPKFPHPAAIDLVIDEYVRTGNEDILTLFTTTLERMALGGVYDQLAGGFHRYSVDEKWIVPHFEKMIYDNSELLKNYVHAYQATNDPLFAAVGRDIIRWVDEWLSDREHGGFFASQDADYSMDDDGDYFTWTLKEAREVLTPDELAVAAAYYDIGEIGEMHHNPRKNVLYIKTGISELAKGIGKPQDEIVQLLGSARQKMLSARLKRPTPYIDKTVYVGWNGLMISAYLDAAQALDLDEVRQFALKSLDRILAQGWDHEARRLSHVISYSDPKATKRAISGTLDDYAFTAIACLDTYEATSAMSYFRFAQSIVDTMLYRFFDTTGGGFFDTDHTTDPSQLIGALSARRKPLQDTPTPSGNSAGAIALLRLHGYTNDDKYRSAAEETLECFAGVIDQFGIYAGTYGIALRLFSTPHTLAVVHGNDQHADELHRAAASVFFLGKAALHLRDGQAVAQNLPPALAETIPQLPAVKQGRSVGVICSNFACQPPVEDPDQLRAALLHAATQK